MEQDLYLQSWGNANMASLPQETLLLFLPKVTPFNCLHTLPLSCLNI